MKKLKYTLLWILVIAGFVFSLWLMVGDNEQKTLNMMRNKMFGKTDTTQVVEKSDTTIKDSVQVVDLLKNSDIPVEVDSVGMWIVAEVNGIPMRFQLDTGCSDLTIGYIDYLFLKRQNRITTNNHKTTNVTLADGNNKTAIDMTIDSLKVGPKILRDVRCLVIKPDSTNLENAPLLLGFNTIRKLATVVMLDYEHNVIRLDNYN